MGQAGWATEEGTARYLKRFEGRISADHFSRRQGLWLSSIGIGTYLGDHDDATDSLYRQALVRAVELGANVIDSAINYRCQRSERAIGAALTELSGRGIDRDQIVLATKGGFLPFDGAPPADIRAYCDEAFIKPGIAELSDVAAGCHCMAPGYLLHQLDCSRKNLGVECLDIYYVHNPETQLSEISRDQFDERLLRAFEALEGAAAAGKIRSYGTATWNGYRNDPQARDYLSLARVAEIAKKAGGERHHFKAVQLPFNLAMHEALTKRNQEADGEHLPILEAAQRLGITVMCSAAILQGQLARGLPPLVGEVFGGLKTDAQRSLQFVRSTPGAAVALLGMKRVAHVEENLEVSRIPPAPWEQYAKLFREAEKG